MSWSIGQLEVKTRYVEMKDENGADRVFPITSLSLPLFYKGSLGMTIGVNRKKFSITYPPSVREVDADGKVLQRGYNVARGVKEIPNKETGLDGEIFVKRLKDKFGNKFARQVVASLQG